MSTPAELAGIIAEELKQSVPAGAHALASSMRQRYGAVVQGILFYGSCLRRGEDTEGILDLYVLVDSYRHFYGGFFLALANWLLPPNVFYLEVKAGGRTVRAKYAVVSLRALARRTSVRSFHSYFWGRFSQPCALIHAASEEVERTVAVALATAVVTFLGRTVPLLPARFDVGELWRAALSESYRAELRSERPDTPGLLYEAAAERYARVTRAALAGLPFPARLESVAGETWVVAQVPPATRRAAAWAWGFRRLQGKLLAVLRLLKGAATFDGGVEYILWKIERHSGISVDPSSLEGRHRLIALAVTFWKLYRRVAFR